jgi:uncharacterized protein YndB with AHSA1/START domain
MTATETSQNSERELVITREFAAPRDLLWDVWTISEHMEKWFGPRGFSTRVKTNEFRVGGKLEYVMIGPDGAEYPGISFFREITPKTRIVATDDFGDGIEKVTGGVDLPAAMEVTTLFDVLTEKTSKLTVRIMHPTIEDKKKHEAMGVVEGWGSSFEKLDEHLAEMQK